MNTRSILEASNAISLNADRLSSARSLAGRTGDQEAAEAYAFLRTLVDGPVRATVQSHLRSI